MAINIPTIAELKTQSVADLIATFAGDLGIIDNQGQLAIIAGSIEDAITTAQVGQTFGNYSLLQHIALQATPVTATLNSEQDPFGLLQDWGITFNNPIKLATASNGNVNATFLAATTVPADTKWRANDGTVVSSISETIVAAAGIVSIAATSDDTGINTNLLTGDELTAVTNISNMDEAATVDVGGFTGGQNDEQQEPFRARLLLAIRAHSQGSQIDRYQLAALSAPGVTRAFVDPRAPTRGAVTIRFMMDEVRAAFNGIPQGTDGVIPIGPAATGDQKLVEDAIIAAGIRPPAADIYILAPIELLVPIQLSALEPNTPDVQAEIQAQIIDLFKRETAPGKILTRSQIDAAISAAQGEISHVLALPATDVEPLPGELPILDGDVVFPT